MMVDVNQNNFSQISPQQITEKGERIYAEQLKAKLEPDNNGKYVVIEVLTEKYFVAETADEAIALGRKELPQGIFHLIKIGSPSAFTLGSRFLYQV